MVPKIIDKGGGERREGEGRERGRWREIGRESEREADIHTDRGREEVGSQDKSKE